MLLFTRVLKNMANNRLPAAHSFTSLNISRVSSFQFSPPRQLWIFERLRMSKFICLWPIFVFDSHVFIGIITRRKVQQPSALYHEFSFIIFQFDCDTINDVKPM